MDASLSRDRRLLALVDDAKECVDERGIELASTLTIDLCDRVVDRPGRLVWPFLRQRVEDIGNSDNPAGKRDVGSGDPDIAVSVPAFVMIERDFSREPQDGEPAAGENPRPD